MSFDTLIPDARAFLKQLSANNTRDWWQAHKSTYDEKLKSPALGLLDALTPSLTKLAEAPVQTKLFRPHRDVRFSKDKTPYTTHLHMMWTVETQARQTVVFFFGIGLDYVTAGAGTMGFDKPVLEDWRKFVDLDTARVQAILDQVKTAGGRLSEPALKRVPSPYPKDHAAADLLRHKGLIASFDVPETGNLVTHLQDIYPILWPVNALILQVAEA